MAKVKNVKPDGLPDGMMKYRTVVLAGEINGETIGDVRLRLLQLQMRSTNGINLIIDSTGGSTHPALELCDLLTTLITARVRGIVVGRCGSAATYILLCCDERVCTPHSRFLVHSSSHTVNHVSTNDLEHLVREAKEFDVILKKMYKDRLTPTAWAHKQPTEEERRNFVEQLIARGDQRFHDWMSAEEAIECGLVTDIVRGKLDIFKG